MNALNFTQNDYQWLVTFEELRNVDAVISRGSDLQTSSDGRSAEQQETIPINQVT